MTTKELQYIEDSLGHLKFLKTQAQTAGGQLQDGVLKNRAQQAVNINQQLYDRFYKLV